MSRFAAPKRARCAPFTAAPARCTFSGSSEPRYAASVASYCEYAAFVFATAFEFRALAKLPTACMKPPSPVIERSAAAIPWGLLIVRSFRVCCADRAPVNWPMPRVELFQLGVQLTQLDDEFF